jgi:cobaltochelatase CobN
VPPGPSGSPSRGRPDVLPTGRNFYAVDTRAIPTPTAWMLGLKSAAQLVERHLQEHGDYPVAMGLSVWGTATMRTGGDDLAQAFALIGVRPKWAPGSQRVVDFEVLPTVGIGRPRIDVTLRISGFFRDAFPNAVQMFDAAVQAVAAQEDEDAERNPIRARILREAPRSRHRARRPKPRACRPAGACSARRPAATARACSRCSTTATGRPTATCPRPTWAAAPMPTGRAATACPRPPRSRAACAP